MDQMQLLETSKIPGTPVFSTEEKEIGQLDELIVDTISGSVRYAVLSFGGLLGIGRDHYPIPWAALKWDQSLGGYITGVTEQQIKSAPDYDPSSLSDRNWEDRLHTNYGARGYWEQFAG